MAMAMVLVSSFKRFRDVGVSVVGTVLAGSVIDHLSVRVGGCGGSRNHSSHSISPRLVTIQIHHATVLVSDGQNHSLHLRHGHDGEGLSVQLHTIRDTTERSLGTRLPV